MLCDAKVKVGACGRRWGKSESTGLDIVLYALEHPNTVQQILAPEDDNTKEITEQIERFLSSIPGFRGAYRVVHSPTWRCTFFDAKSTGRIPLRPTTIRARTLGPTGKGVRGRNAHRVIVDEAAFVDDKIMERVVTPLLADYNGDLILISTPEGRNHFWQAFERGQDPLQPRFKSFQFPSASNPFLPRDYLQAERETKTERTFKIEYEAQFADAEGQVFRYITEACTGAWEQPVPGRQYAAGLDLARVNDFTVLTVIDKAARSVVYQDRFNKIDWPAQEDRIAATVARYNNASLLMETNHVGDALVRGLQRKGVRVQEFVTTAASKPDLIDALAAAFERREIVLPRRELVTSAGHSCAVMVNELMAYAYQRTASGYVRMNAPEGQHDDTVISLALAWRMLTQQPEKPSYTPSFAAAGSAWLENN